MIKVSRKEIRKMIEEELKKLVDEDVVVGHEEKNTTTPPLGTSSLSKVLYDEFDDEDDHECQGDGCLACTGIATLINETLPEIADDITETFNSLDHKFHKGKL